MLTLRSIDILCFRNCSRQQRISLKKLDEELRERLIVPREILTLRTNLSLLHLPNQNKEEDIVSPDIREKRHLKIVNIPSNKVYFKG